MKHFISKNRILLLICFFQIVLNKRPPETFKKPIKPFISVLSPDSLKQFEKTSDFNKNKFLQKKEVKPFISVLTPNTMKQFLLEEDANSEKGTKANFAVKCMYIDEYSLYDISKLGINKFKEGTTAFKEKINNITIFYNFCYNLKGNEIKDDDIKEKCEEKEKQMFYVENGKCKPFAKKIGKGNTWTKLKNNTDNATVLKIELESEEPNHKIYYMLKCNKNLEKKEKKFIEENSYYNLNNVTVLYFETREACEKADFYIIWKFINDFDYIFAIIIILFGLFNCILGQRLAKYTSFILALFGLVVLVLFASQFILPSGCDYWIIWVMLALGIILGCTAGYFVFKYHDKFMAFLVGGLAGFLLGEFFFNLFGSLINLNPTLIQILFILICIILSIILAYFFREYTIIISTSFIGAYALIRGISLFAGYFPSEYTVIDLKKRKETDQLKDLLTWRVYVYLVFILIAFGLSIYIQIKINKNIKKKTEGEEAEDENLKPKELKDK